MTASLILHHDAGSPGSIRVRKAMALKSLAWRSHGLDGDAAARWRRAVGTPTVLQAGAEFHVGAEVIFDLLEEARPEPTFYPNGNRGMPLALAFWSMHYFRVVVTQLVGGNKSGAVNASISHAVLIERQLADGRDFLQGPQPGIADLEAYSAFVALAEVGLDCLPVFESCPHIRGWRDRLDALGEGEPDSISLEECVDELNTVATDQDDLSAESRNVRVRYVGDDQWIQVRSFHRDRNQIEAQLHHPDFGVICARYLAAFVELDVSS